MTHSYTQIMMVKMASRAMSEQKLGMNPMHRGMTTIRAGKAQESKASAGRNALRHCLRSFPGRT